MLDILCIVVLLLQVGLRMDGGMNTGRMLCDRNFLMVVGGATS